MRVRNRLFLLVEQYTVTVVDGIYITAEIGIAEIIDHLQKKSDLKEVQEKISIKTRNLTINIIYFSIHNISCAII